MGATSQDELRALLFTLREFGVTEYEADGVRLRLAPTLTGASSAPSAEVRRYPDDAPLVSTDGPSTWDEVMTAIPPPGSKPVADG